MTSRKPTAHSRAKSDAGYTLIEIIVAMGIFSIFLAMFIAGVIAVSRATTQASTDAQTSSAIGVAVQRIERSVRYADAINHPGTASGFSYVEWHTDSTTSSTGIDTCTQLRYSPDDGTLAIRTWEESSAPSTGKWNVMLGQMRGEADNEYPFDLFAAASGISNYQGLTLHIIAGLDDAAGTETTTTIYAKNSSVDSISNTATAAGQSARPVCAGTGYRP